MNTREPTVKSHTASVKTVYGNGTYSKSLETFLRMTDSLGCSILDDAKSTGSFTEIEKKWRT